MTDSPKFRADQVGSLLRPASLLRARARHEAGEIGDGELRHIEDEAIAAAVAMQEASGIDVLTDGEFRRRDFRTGFVDAVDGMAMRTWDMPWHGAAGVTKLRSHTWVVTGRLKQRKRLAAGEAAFVRGRTAMPVKVTLIAPGFLVDRFWKDGETDKHYSSREELAAEMAAITRAEVEALIAEGVGYVQLDNPGYGAFLGAHGAASPDSGALLRWHGAVIVGRTLQEAVMRAILAEEHAGQLVTALSHGRPLAPVPSHVNRGDLYAKVLSARTHDMHWEWASTFVTVSPDAHGRA
jgi:methionine synthase II (cobalamin-independent)